MKALMTLVTALICLFSCGQALADQILWEMQKEGKTEVIYSLRTGQPRTVLVRGIQKLVTAEAGLVASNLPPNDSRLYTPKLAKGLSPTEPEKFAVRVYLKDLKRLGVVPESGKQTFLGRRYKAVGITGRSYRVGF